MDKYVVRTPETDRRLLLVPASADELRDTAFASAARTTDQITENGSGTTLGLESLLSENGFTLDGSGFLVVPRAGLYLVLLTITWDWQTPGAIQRILGLNRNGTGSSFAAFNSTVGDGHTDQISFLTRCAAGDTLAPYVTNVNGGNLTVVSTAIMQVVCVAPYVT